MAFPKVLTVLAALLAGCPAGGGPYIRRDYRPPASLAVLPFDNQTTDLDGPVVARVWFDRRLSELKGYPTQPLESIDAALQGLGITDGGQLRSRSLAELCQALKADALVYGDVLEFGTKTTGFLNVRQVHVAFVMKDCLTGTDLWRAEGIGAASDATLSPPAALRAGLKSLGSQLAEKALGSPLREQTLDMVWNAIEFLPPAAGSLP